MVCRWGSQIIDTNSHCRSLYGEPPEYKYYSSRWQLSYNYKTSYSNFAKSGVVIQSSFSVDNTPCRKVYYYSKSLTDTGTSGLSRLTCRHKNSIIGAVYFFAIIQIGHLKLAIVIGLLEHQGHQELMEGWGHQGVMEHQGHQEMMGLMEHQGQQDLLEQQGHQEMMGVMEHQEHQELMERQGHQEMMGVMGRQGHQG